ncbi:uncharacterized protein SCHCODRAFT_02144276 [Schizophyllum commune H4-8]|uniref:Uncharacterized protein n=1 Tax=Schizophyllum commune (strain H4-8 / FGSC 9210) TaxID=578458 RepID=D8PKU3_SCHCM|nr:uncharacterized protein SCHCODRAFT_02144276 [Schizophyllum commune H4-8]KAI5897559.1 hypothetical protein SCHCODRAFT_02144276 [Schizophyllum commune H4-8]
MFAATALTLLSGAALVSAAGLRSAAVSQYGSAEGDLVLKQLGKDFVVGSAEAETTISATVENGELTMVCPTKGLKAALVPLSAATEPGVYTLEFITSSQDELPKGSVFGGWSISDDRTGLTNDNLTMVVNEIDGNKGAFDVERDHTSGVSAIVYVNREESGTPATRPWYIVLDDSKDVQC